MKSDTDDNRESAQTVRISAWKLENLQELEALRLKIEARSEQMAARLLAKKGKPTAEEFLDLLRECELPDAVYEVAKHYVIGVKRHNPKHHRHNMEAAIRFEAEYFHRHGEWPSELGVSVKAYGTDTHRKRVNQWRKTPAYRAKRDSEFQRQQAKKQERRDRADERGKASAKARAAARKANWPEFLATVEGAAKQRRSRQG